MAVIHTHICCSKGIDKVTYVDVSHEHTYTCSSVISAMSSSSSSCSHISNELLELILTYLELILTYHLSSRGVCPQQRQRAPYPHRPQQRQRAPFPHSPLGRVSYVHVDTKGGVDTRWPWGTLHLGAVVGVPIEAVMR